MIKMINRFKVLQYSLFEFVQFIFSSRKELLRGRKNLLSWMPMFSHLKIKLHVSVVQCWVWKTKINIFSDIPCSCCSVLSMKDKHVFSLILEQCLNSFISIHNLEISDVVHFEFFKVCLRILHSLLGVIF